MIPETMERIKNSERAVSPVIGVILMVAITVILAAVIAAFVLGFGADQDSAPQASWGVSANDSANDSAVTFTHEGGDAVDASQLQITLNGEVLDGADVGDFEDMLRAGNSVTADQGDAGDAGTYRLIWHQDGGDDTSVLRTYQHDGN